MEPQVPAELCPWDPLIHLQVPGGVSGKVGEGELGPYRREQQGLSCQEGPGVGSGTWPLTPTLLPLSSGGYTTGPGPLVSLLRQRARPYLFSNSLPPAVVGCASKALDLLMESNAIVQSMAAKTKRCGAWQGWGRLGWGSCVFITHFGLPVPLPGSPSASLGLHLSLLGHPADSGTDLGSHAYQECM